MTPNDSRRAWLKNTARATMAGVLGWVGARALQTGAWACPVNASCGACGLRNACPQAVVDAASPAPPSPEARYG